MIYEILETLHKHGIMHGDFYPRNIIRREDGTFCVIDFQNAEIGHTCPREEECYELSHFRTKLHI
ncbi:hypothetical protein BDP27DRAFT_1349948 [Rhodocollybia butyracea]|uniref:Protein kinase domain-containing protein n=1 Tax=Rhodocollybia butyracea TaxID=206335 RepID=A0A9P5P5L0_9AGAR|nr:hypothetical protein BDP27DRAFT_1349948 [Rhodocollybia butyracea]